MNIFIAFFVLVYMLMIFVLLIMTNLISTNIQWWNSYIYFYLICFDLNFWPVVLLVKHFDSVSSIVAFLLNNYVTIFIFYLYMIFALLVVISLIGKNFLLNYFVVEQTQTLVSILLFFLVIFIRYFITLIFEWGSFCCHFFICQISVY